MQPRGWTRLGGGCSLGCFITTWRRLKKKHNLKIENFALFSRLAEDLSQGNNLSDSSEGLFCPFFFLFYLAYVFLFYLAYFFLFNLYFFFFYLAMPHTCGILVPLPGIKPTCCALQEQSEPLDHQGSERGGCSEEVGEEPG